MTSDRPLRIAVVAGEESGDVLGADLVAALARASQRRTELVGVGGRHLQALGLAPIFDPAEIAIMGLSAVLRDLPRLALRIGQTARAIAAARPDCLVTIDSPAFNLRVAKKVRGLAPEIPIVKYVCPSVWAWGPGRAAKMRAYTDHVLCVLPFEVGELERLGGPPGTYVGHRLAHDPGVAAAAARQRARSADAGERTLLVLPGSRRGEVRGHIDLFARTVEVLARRGVAPRLVIPTVPHVEPLVREAVRGWPHRPEIVLEAERKWQVFGEADAALSVSGTVLLELALCGVPTLSCYRMDLGMRLASGLVTVWSAALPNLIADRPMVPEFINDSARPETLARYLELMLEDTPLRRWALEGFEEVRRRMATERPAGEIAAEVVLRHVRGEGPPG